ncbi:MAG: hypothetical protein R6V45_07035 [Oceanipulchritudo sp.]
MKLSSIAVPAILLLGVALFSGCTSPRLERAVRDHPRGEAYAPDNIYAEAELPAAVRTVAVLPFGTDRLAHPFMPEVETVLINKLRAGGRLNVVLVPASLVHEVTGSYSVAYNEPLPVELFERVREAYRADAILQTEVTAFRPYKPMLLGLRSRLLERSGKQVLWACDEIFDGGNKAVLTGARKYAEVHLDQPYPLQSSYSSLLSPQRFAGYVGETLYATLPGYRQAL